MSNSKSYKTFECSYCGFCWTTLDYKTFKRKSKSVSWTEQKSNCPQCGRETTMIEDHRKVNQDEYND